MPNPLQAQMEAVQREALHRTQMAALRTANGSYVCAEDGGAGALVADRPSVGPWEIFGLVWHGDDRVAIVAVNGKYVTLFPDLVPFLAPAADGVGPNELFRAVWHGDDRVSFQAANGSYVCAENGGGGALLPNRPAVGEWEKFWLEVPSL